MLDDELEAKSAKQKLSDQLADVGAFGRMKRFEVTSTTTWTLAGPDGEAFNRLGNTP